MKMNRAKMTQKDKYKVNKIIVNKNIQIEPNI